MSADPIGATVAETGSSFNFSAAFVLWNRITPPAINDSGPIFPTLIARLSLTVNPYLRQPPNNPTDATPLRGLVINALTLPIQELCRRHRFHRPGHDSSAW